MELKNIKKAYFIGVGGIGMSAIARYFNAMHIEVLGYDKTPSPLTDKLISEGISIHFTDTPECITNDVDIVVYTPAIPETLKEYQRVKDSNIPVFKRAEVLGIISRNHNTIAIAGTHGKTSVTALLSHILHHSGIKINAFIGGIAKNYHSNCIMSQNPEYMVVEADEFDRSFLKLSPNLGIITSVDADHLDIYGDHDQIIQSFQDFAGKVSEHVYVEYDISDHFINCSSYGVNPNSNIKITNTYIKDGFQFFSITDGENTITDIKYHLPGEYNLKNVAAAITIAWQCGVSAWQIKQAIGTFKGVDRRFDVQYRDEERVYIDDYAHHPTEIASCVDAVRTLYPDRKLTGIFQPHLFSRTKDFADDFAQSLSLMDEIILLPIYPAREKPMAGITSQIILDKIQTKNKKILQKENLLNYIKSLSPELLVTMGAGDIDRFVPKIKQYFEEN